LASVLAAVSINAQAFVAMDELISNSQEYIDSPEKTNELLSDSERYSYEISPAAQMGLDVKSRSKIERDATNAMADFFRGEEHRTRYARMTDPVEKANYAREYSWLNLANNNSRITVASKETQERYQISANDIESTDFSRLYKFFVGLKNTNPRFNFTDSQIREFVMKILEAKSRSGESNVDQILADLMGDLEKFEQRENKESVDVALRDITSNLQELQASLGSSDAPLLSDFLDAAHGTAADSDTLSSIHASMDSPVEASSTENENFLAGLGWSEASGESLGLTNIPEPQSESPLDWTNSAGGGGQLTAALDTATINDVSGSSSNLRNYAGGYFGGAPDTSKSAKSKTTDSTGNSSLFNAGASTTETSEAVKHEGNGNERSSGTAGQRAANGNTGTTTHTADTGNGVNLLETASNGPGQLEMSAPLDLTKSASGTTAPGTQSTNGSGSNNAAPTPEWATQQATDMADFLGLVKGSQEREKYIASTAQSYASTVPPDSNAVSSTDGSAANHSSTLAQNGTTGDNAASSPTGENNSLICRKELTANFVPAYTKANVMCTTVCTPAMQEQLKNMTQEQSTRLQHYTEVGNKFAKGLGESKEIEHMTDEERERFALKLVKVLENTQGVCEIVTNPNYRTKIQKFEETQNQLERHLEKLASNIEGAPSASDGSVQNGVSLKHIESFAKNHKQFNPSSPPVLQAQNNSKCLKPQDLESNPVQKQKLLQDYVKWQQKISPSKENWREQIQRTARFIAGTKNAEDEARIKATKEVISKNLDLLPIGLATETNLEAKRQVMQKLFSEAGVSIPIQESDRPSEKLALYSIDKGWKYLEESYRNNQHCIPQPFPEDPASLNEADQENMMFFVESLHLGSYKFMSKDMALINPITAEGCPTNPDIFSLNVVHSITASMANFRLRAFNDAANSETTSFYSKSPSGPMTDLLKKCAGQFKNIASMSMKLFSTDQPGNNSKRSELALADRYFNEKVALDGTSSTLGNGNLATAPHDGIPSTPSQR